MVTVKIALLNSWNPSEEVYQQLVERLNESDRQRIIRYRRRSDRLCFLVGRLLLLKFVEELLGEAAPLNDDYRQNGTTQVVLGYNSSGKPFLVQPGWKHHTIEFNITHDEQVVMVAGYTRAKNEKNEAGVGIDIMRIDRSGVDAEGLEDVLIEQLHPIELSTFRATFDLSASYNATAETAHLNYLIRMWTAKEAYTKAIGTGLGMEFKEIALVGLDHLDREACMVKISKDTTSTSAQIEMAATESLSFALPETNDWNIKHGNLILGPVLQMGERTVAWTRFAWSVVAPREMNNATAPLEDVLEFTIVDISNLEAMAVTKSAHCAGS